MMKYFYTENTIARYRRKFKAFAIAAAAIGALSLAACIIMCVFTGTGNAVIMERAVIITAVASGWVVIFLLDEAVLPAEREYRHEEHMLAAETESVEGRVTVTGERTDITKSISVQRVMLDTGKEIRRLSVNRRNSAELRKAGAHLRLIIAHGYVIGYEVTE